MSRRFYFSFVAFALTLATTVALVARGGAGNASASSDAALALPASDFIIVFDARRALNETLPTLLADNPSLLGKLNTRLAEFEQHTGINPRSFESVAVGGRLSPARPHGHDGVVILRGSFDSARLLETAFASAKKEVQFEREAQQYEGRTIHVIKSVRSLRKEGATVQGTERNNKGIAVTALAPNTLAAGDVEGVRAAIDASLGRGRVDDELVRLATLRPGAIVGFSGRLPQGTAAKLAPGLPGPGAGFLASVREFYGSFGTSGADAEVFVALRTENAEQAAEIGQAINAVKGFVGLGVGRSSGKDPQTVSAFADLVKGLNITTQGNEVQIDFRVPQSSIGALLRGR